MEPREIKALLELMQEYGLVELQIEDKKGKIRLVRGAMTPATAHHESAPRPTPGEITNPIADARSAISRLRWPGFRQTQLCPA